MLNYITRIDVYETLCPQQMLVHKGGKIKNWGGECRDVTPTKSLSQSGCERRIEVFVKIQKKKFWGGGGRGRGRFWGVRVDVNEELKSFWENLQKKKSGGGGSVWGGGGGVRVDVNEELKFLCKFTKKKWGGQGGGVGGGGSGWMRTKN